MKFVKGDLIKAFENGEVDIIVHQVDCQGGMGRGITAQIKREYPQHFNDYMNFIEYLSGTGKHLLGLFVETVFDDAGSIVGVFG